MNPEAQLKLQALLDGELTPAEMKPVADELARDPQAQALYAELQHTRALLADNESQLKLPVAGEFYWSQIARQIELQSQAKPAPEAPPGLPQWVQEWWKWLAPLGAVAMLALVLLSAWQPAQQPAMAALNGIEVETNLPDVGAITFRSDMEGISVVWVDTN